MMYVYGLAGVGAISLLLQTEGGGGAHISEASAVIACFRSHN